MLIACVLTTITEGITIFPNLKKKVHEIFNFISELRKKAY